MQGNVPLTARFLIAVTAEHIILAIIFVINAAVPPDRLPTMAMPHTQRIVAQKRGLP